ncbi:AIPR family protein [Tepidibacter sp. Z1-5]|uniref:AIPR family protein n=1 Tax=Tepidibacter sp. Z1-5 TaxID=3134138 RepID=UPI0030BEFA13
MGGLIRTMVKLKLDKFCEDNSIENKDLGFMYFIYSIYNDIEYSDTDISDIIKGSSDVVDGSEDKQIDIISIHKYDEEAIIKIFQVKNQNGFKSNTLIHMKNGLEWIFEKTNDALKLNKNKKFISKIKEVRSVLKEYSYSNVHIEVYYACLGNTNDIDYRGEFDQELKEIVKKYEQVGFGNFKFQLLGVEEINEELKLIEMKNKKINTNLNILYDANRPSLIETYKNNLKSVVCTVKASEIAKLISEDKNDILFDKNIRKYLEQRGKVNKSIYETCVDEDESRLFWFLNNGITIMCDTFSVDKIPNEAKIKIDNVQIINGCQTSTTLYKAMKDGKLVSDTEVLIKIYASDDKKIVDKITVATNNQNPINLRDLRANDEIQLNIQIYINNKYNYYFERKRNEFKDVDKKKIITNEKVGQSYLGIILRKPHRALSSKKDVFDKEYNNIFNSNSFAKLMFSHLIYMYVENKKKNTNFEDIDDQLTTDLILYGSYHISSILGNLIININNSKNDNKKIEKINLDIINEELNLNEFYDEAIKQMVSKLETLDEETTNNMIKYLKRKESVDVINATINNIISSKEVALTVD